MALLRAVCEGSRAWGTRWTVAEGLKAATTHHSARGSRSHGRPARLPGHRPSRRPARPGVGASLRGSSVSGRDGGSLEAVSSRVHAFAPHGPACVPSLSWPQIQRQADRDKLSVWKQSRGHCGQGQGVGSPGGS